MAAAQPGQGVTDRTPGVLVCVYYRVAGADSQRVISAVREFQRTLRQSARVDAVEVLLRCHLPPHRSPASPPDARPDPVTLHAPADEPVVDAADDATVMETYRLRLPDAGADLALRDFLATLEAASSPLAGLLRGTRHVELFAPCVL